MSTPQKIEEFWAWWGAAQERLDGALRDPDGRRTAIDEVHMRVKRLGLYGDVIPLPGGTDLIIGSADGDDEKRIVAAHWLLGAPKHSAGAAPQAADADAAPADPPRFAFATHRPAQPIEHLMGVAVPGDPPLPIAAMRFAARWRLDDDRVDVAVWVGPRVKEKRAKALVPALLRSAIGELEVDAWIGDVSIARDEPAGATDLAGFVRAFADEVSERAEPRWYLYEYEKPDGTPLTVTLRRPIQPARHPFLDGCLTIRTQLQTTDPDEGDRIQAQLLDGMPGDILPVGSVTDQGWRTTFIYANRRSPTIAMLKARADMLGGEFGSGWDPSWHQIRHLTHTDPKSRLRLVRTSDPRVARG